MRRARLVVVLLALIAASLLVPALAGGAQFSQSIQLLGASPVSVRGIPVRLTGQLTVDFHGDPASGCASRGLCGYTGTVSWRPPATGALVVYTYREHGRIVQQLSLELGNSPYVAGGVATAKVRLSSSPPLASTILSSCLDATRAGLSLSLPVRHGRVAFTLAGADPALLGTRCAGPLDGDVMPAIPAPTVAVGAILRGRTAVALSAARSFASHGFAGTVQSSLALALGAPGRVQRTRPGKRASGYRQIQVLYRATLSGSVVERTRGSADPDVCLLLGSCGLGGTVTLTPPATAGHADIGVIARARTPYPDLLAAIGLSTRRRAKGVLLAGGAVTWNGGVARAALVRGSTSCRDSAPLGPGTIILTANRGRLHARYAPGLGALTARTRCPGPGDANATSVATGVLPVARLARRTIRLSLTTGSTFADYGYEVRTVPHLTLTLTRLRVRTAAGFSSALSSALGSFSATSF